MFALATSDPGQVVLVANTSPPQARLAGVAALPPQWQGQALPNVLPPPALAAAKQEATGAGLVLVRLAQMWVVPDG